LSDLEWKNIMTQDGLKDKHREAIIAILTAHPRVERAVLFGSRAMGTHSATSDVDIALYGNDLTLDDLARLNAEISELPIPQRVDLLPHSQIESQKLLDHIKKHGVEWISKNMNSPNRLKQNNPGFPRVKLGKHCRKIGSGATPRGGSKVYLDHGEVALIRSQNVRNEGFHRNGLAFITREHARQLSNVVVEQHDVLLNITGDSVARCCQVDPDVLPARVNQHVAIIRPDKDEINPRFLRYFLISEAMQSQMLAWAHAGATRKALTKEMIESFEVPKPEIGTQNTIAHILGSLDDKIELNRRMNQTLEKMAAAIFKSWFIDFDPVIDNALRAGNPIPDAFEDRATRRAEVLEQDDIPHLPQHIADLFPDQFEDSELGPIPRGWAVQPISRQIELIGGGTPKTNRKEYWGGSIPWFSVKDMPSEGDVFVVDTEKHISDAGLNNSSTRILEKGVTIISARGTVGKCAIVGRPMAMNQSCYGIKGINEDTDYYIFYLVTTKVSELQRSGHGSVFNTITRQTFDSINFPCPGDKLPRSFNKLIEGQFDSMLSILFQNSTLSTMRDLMLPKLLSGELDISSIEFTNEEITQ